MLLYTIQPEEVLNIIQQEGTFRPEKNKLSNPEFLPAYDWLREKMEERIGEAPDKERYPVWAWYSMDGEYSNILGEDWIKEDDYLLVLDIPDDRVVLTDFNAWHYVLNNWYYAPELKDKEYDKMTEKYKRFLYGPGITSSKDVRKTWEKIFLDEKPSGIYSEVHTFDENDKPIVEKNIVQATFWEIRQEDVVKVVDLRKDREVER